MTMIRLLRGCAAFCLAIVVGQVSIWPKSEGPCKGPSDLISVKVRILSEAPPKYEYEVRNNHSAAIRSLSLGTSEHQEMRINALNVPESIGAPEGWSGERLSSEESDYMHIYWAPKAAESRIQPGTGLAGFTLTMRARGRGKPKLYGADGKPIRGLDMRRAPVTAVFEDGLCAWTRAAVEAGK